MIVIGVAIVNVATISAVDLAASTSIILGILASSVALVIWIIYGLVNAAVMRAPDAPSGLQWTGLQGIGAAIGSFLLLPLASFDLADTVSGSEVLRFVGWALVMGLAGSWLATWFWVFASRLCRWLSLPSSLLPKLLSRGHDDRRTCHADGQTCRHAGRLHHRRNCRQSGQHPA
jgi:drug/metabolite transporter (DMT)-like permease